jgi:hypothetical protein
MVGIVEFEELEMKKHKTFFFLICLLRYIRNLQFRQTFFCLLRYIRNL